MSAILGRPGRRRSKPSASPVNHRVEVDGRSYRVCVTVGGHVLLVGLKCKRGGERFLDVDGRAARRAIKAAGL